MEFFQKKKKKKKTIDHHFGNDQKDIFQAKKIEIIGKIQAEFTEKENIHS